MRVRVAIRSFNALIRERRFLNTLKYRLFAVQLWSHKVLRYASPLLWLGALTANLALVARARDPVHDPYLYDPYLYMLIGQSLMLIFGAIGFVLHDHRRKLGLFGKPYYFLLTNLASLIATLRYLRGERMIVWNPIR